ncbi:hypothetical protein ACGFR8_24685 [Streptomyces brevispora]
MGMKRTGTAQGADMPGADTPEAGMTLPPRSRIGGTLLMGGSRVCWPR